ncbi:MAG: APC family permease [Dehalococcoidia bacterium]|nr:APC family permease [Dehalococcoidia bacterium]
MAEAKLRREVSALHAVMILVGYIVGSAIFILVGPLAGLSGPGLFVAFGIAAIPAIFVCLYNTQLSTALPVTGANYIAISRFVHPFAGWIGGGILIAVFFGLASIAWGFAGFLSYLVPGIPVMAVAMGVVVFFAVINYFGIRFAAWIQTLLVLTFLVALLLFTFGGLPHIDPRLHTPLFPLGFGPVLFTAVIAYMTFTGFTVITDIAGEIRNPRRNIPLALGISFAIVLFIYMLVTYVLTGVMDWRALGESPAALAEASTVFFPPGLTLFIAIGGLLAAATTINGIFLATPRDLLLYGKDKVLPEFVGRINQRFGTPDGAILLILIAGLVGVSIAMRIEQYALFTVMCFMMFHILIVIGLIRMSRKMPHLLKKAPWKLSRGWMWFTYIGMIFFAGLFFVIGMTTLSWTGLGLFWGLFAAGCLYYYFRWLYLRRRGIDIVTDAKKFIVMTAEELEVD